MYTFRSTLIGKNVYYTQFMAEIRNFPFCAICECAALHKNGFAYLILSLCPPPQTALLLLAYFLTVFISFPHTRLQSGVSLNLQNIVNSLEVVLAHKIIFHPCRESEMKASRYRKVDQQNDLFSPLLCFSLTI